MAIQIRRIAARFALLLAAAAIVPLVAFGVASILSLQRGTHESIVAGNLNVATRAAEEIRRYIVLDAAILKALAADLQNTGLEPWQQDRILKNFVVEFREFREITLLDESGRMLATSRIGKPRLGIPGETPLTIDGVSISPLRVDEDLLPTSIFAVHLKRLNQPAGWLMGEFGLEEMWRMVDRIRIGAHGYAMVVAPDGALLAHGDADKKTLVAQAKNVAANPLLADMRANGTGAPLAREYIDDDGRSTLGVAAAIPQIGWTIVVEQPTHEAYGSAAQLERQLVISISAALLVTISIGYLFGRSFINPILALQRATHGVAAGQLDTRVTIRRSDELGELGASFNIMANRLAELQEDVKKKERQAMFGRVAAGLVHDLSHPIQNIGNNTRLLLRDDVDAESREMFRKTIQRELETLKRFMEDLRNLVKPKPVERFAMDVNGSVSEIVEAMRGDGERHGVTVEAQFAPGPLIIEGDRFALGRVFRNLIINAIQATESGGRVTVGTAPAGEHIEVTVADSGSGIPADRLALIFEDFVTTKTRGLGLGLAISKRIVEQLDGTIAVESEVGKGTSFRLRFPACDDRSASAAAS